MELPPKHPSLPGSPFSERRWEPVTPPLQGHTESIPTAVLAHVWLWILGARGGSPTLTGQAVPKHSASCHHLPWPMAPLLRHALATPPKHVSSASPLPGLPHAPALGSYLPCET